MPNTNLPKVSARLETILASAYAATATTYNIASGTDINGSALAGYYGLTIDGGTANEQFDVVTISGTTCTVVVRDCDPSNPLASRTRTVPAHGKGASVKITDYPLMGFIRSLLNGDYTFDNILAYTSAPTFTSAAQIITKAYADALAIAGAPNGSTSAKGIFQEATAAQINSGTATGSTGAVLAISPDQLALTNLALAAAGTSGTATGSGNKLVDAADVSSAAASGKIVRANGTALPALNGSALTGITPGQVGALTGFGAWAAATADGAGHQAATDGILVLSATGSTFGGFVIKSDSASTPTTIRASAAPSTTGASAFVMCPVKKNDYYLITVTGTPSSSNYYFMPLS